jgi:bacterioferritin-associated ferredoxin
MEACICTGLTARDVEELVRRGGRTLENIVKLCGAGRCASCREMVEDILRRRAALDRAAGGSAAVRAPDAEHETEPAQEKQHGTQWSRWYWS